ncbi:hypothetical protein H4687_006070 [Streptomyces stelliscabiei]|uniref:Uncharacterized protein n=1 Tax=Streptomyces stelliscabiei TaxID=146820 RepID=A0A8I0PC64_9ACTN|nr:hypothetical protein [Streptomyces stelliscabiei]
MADDELPLAAGDQQPGATPAEIEFARRWRDMSKVVFSSTIDKVDWNTRLVTGDAVAEITRLKAACPFSSIVSGSHVGELRTGNCLETRRASDPAGDQWAWPSRGQCPNGLVSSGERRPGK